MTYTTDEAAAILRSSPQSLTRLAREGFFGSGAHQERLGKLRAWRFETELINNLAAWYGEPYGWPLRPGRRAE